MSDYNLSDSGKRSTYDSGMVREPEDNKPRFDLLIPEGVAFQDQMLTRFAICMTKGAEKYTERNWEKASSKEELARYKSSAFRHFMQWLTDESDEDHAAALMFNLLAAETVKSKITDV